MILRASLDDDGKLLAERIDAAVKEAGGPAQVSRLSETPARTLSKYMAGDATPSATALARIAEATQKPMDWFFDRSAMALSGVTSITGGQPYEADIVRIPILDVTAGAGSGEENDSEEVVAQLPFPAGFLRRLRINPACVRAIRVRGDSMEPTIPDGVLVLVDERAKNLIDGRVYALRGPFGLRLKRLQRQTDGSVILISDNRELYHPEHLRADEAAQIDVVGRVFWTEKII